MLRTALFVFFIILNQSTFSQNNDIEILKKMNSDWINASVTKDTAMLSRIFANDMILITAAGRKMTRKDLLLNAFNQNLLSANIDSVDVRLITPDVGIVTAYLSFTVPAGAEKIMGKNCYQDVYIKRKNRWYAVSAHVTLLK
jgi:uncharacterized protein (TIGR02246 family)